MASLQTVMLILGLSQEPGQGLTFAQASAANSLFSQTGRFYPALPPEKDLLPGPWHRQFLVCRFVELSFAQEHLQSVEHLLKRGHLSLPGMQLMSRR
ncbi:hypothetical protein [Enterobacter ludwigii]|uniref:hypothetical protein n=1 Tax=Enterobacter ludwigii TaxID=299767 RepID=UPI003F6F663A